MIVWGAWTWGFPGTTRPAAFCARRAWWCCPRFVRERASVVGATAGSCPRAPTSFGVGFVPLSALYPPRFAVRASDAFSRAYTSTCAFRSCLAVYGPYSEREMGVVGCGGMLMALVARLAVSFLSRVSIKNTPARLWAGVFFRVGAPYAYPGALRAYRQGRSQSGSMCALAA